MKDITKIEFEKYKCFDGPSTIENIKPINIIIGKNNIGKSSILDIIEMMNDAELKFNNPQTSIYIERKLTEEEVGTQFHSGHYGGVIDGDHYEFGKKYIGETFRFCLKAEIKGYGTGISMITDYANDLTQKFSIYDERAKYYWVNLAKAIIYNTLITKRIYAERNILPEKDDSSMEINGYGEGITRIISNFLNKSVHKEELVRENLLNKLNEIMGTDANFTEIVTQQIDTDDGIKWEIYLREEKKGRIALSQSGSGLKTILMVLVYTILIPSIENKELDNYIFLFEELENNLHPSLERRLLKYIEEVSKQGAIFFLTTHSSTALDSFQNKDNAQLYHVIKEDGNVTIKTLTDYYGKSGCIDDLGLKASELLQSNGIIWVEGPSDRVYINKWIELWSNGKYTEGMDYQCVFYGGRLLSHLSLDDSSIDDLIEIINVNKNVIIVIDSDKTSSEKIISKTKQRVKKEFEAHGKLCWITSGKEIENYLSKELIASYYKKEIDKELKQYAKIDKYLDNVIGQGTGNKFNNTKVKFAKKVIEGMTLENMQGKLDLDIQMKKVIEEIEQWNKD